MTAYWYILLHEREHCVAQQADIGLGNLHPQTGIRKRGRRTECNVRGWQQRTCVHLAELDRNALCIDRDPALCGKVRAVQMPIAACDPKRRAAERKLALY